MIREFNDEDIPFIIEKLSFFNVLINKDDIINHPFTKYLIYEDNGLKIGLLDYSLYYDRIEINYLFIVEPYRRRGFAKKLLDFLISMYYNNNVVNITLEVSEKNIAAINLYKKIGFKSEAMRENYYGNGENAILMMWRY